MPVQNQAVQKTTLPSVTLGEPTFHLFLGQVQRTVYMRITNSSQGGKNTRKANCLTSTGRVTLATGEEHLFSHINTLAHLPGAIVACLVPRYVGFFFFGLKPTKSAKYMSKKQNEKNRKEKGILRS